MTPLLNVIAIDTAIEDIPFNVEVLVSVTSTLPCRVDGGIYSYAANGSTYVSGTPKQRGVTASVVLSSSETKVYYSSVKRSSWHLKSSVCSVVC